MDQVTYTRFLRRHEDFERFFLRREQGFDRGQLTMRTIKLVALQVQLGALLNEWNQYKYWSGHRLTDNNKMLQEYGRVLHAAVAVGKDFQVNLLNNPERYIYQMVLPEWIYINQLVSEMHTEGKRVFSQLMHEIWHLGQLFGYSEDDLAAAFDRQDTKNRNLHAYDY